MYSLIFLFLFLIIFFIGFCFLAEWHIQHGLFNAKVIIVEP